MSKKICFLTTGIAVVLVAYLLIGWLKGGDKINQIREEAFYGHLRVLMSDLDAKKRIEACIGLGRLRDPRAVPHLIRALGDRGYVREPGHVAYVCQAAEEALVKIGTPAVPHLCQALRDIDSNVREAACRALGQIGDLQAVPHLCQALRDSNVAVREAACRALGRIGDRQAVPHLIQTLGDSVSYVRSTACWALGAIGDPQAIPHLTKKLKDEDSSVRGAAEEAIRQIRARQAGRQSQP
jgi:HEAT repeat protein